VSASDLDFGAYDPLSGADKDGQSAISVTCTNGSAYNVGLSNGAGVGATTAVRKMTITGGGAETLDYSLYRDSNRSQVWGESIGVDTVSGAGSGAQQSIDVYGRAPGSQPAKSGSYLDTVTVTVTF
jgi:spore coat protein U-like protein